jgi:hypothetical protein
MHIVQDNLPSEFLARKNKISIPPSKLEGRVA